MHTDRKDQVTLFLNTIWMNGVWGRWGSRVGGKEGKGVGLDGAAPHSYDA